MIFETKSQTVADPRAIYELNILIGGKPITEYTHEGNTFVEGRKGSEFEVEFKNKTNKQVLVVPSVDGKSPFDKSVAGVDSRGYIVRPWGSIRIPGWTLDQSNVAKFTFADKDASYVAQTAEEGEVLQNGVIGVIVFSEKAKPKPVEHIHHYHPYPGIGTPTIPRTPWPQYPGQWPNTGPTLCGTATMNNVQSDSLVKSVMRGATAQNATLSASATVDASHENTSMEMGTGFGAKAEFRTHSQTFERDAMVATLQLYYDSRRNLEKRGIEVVKKEQRHLNDLPQAFAGLGCRPPEGWNG